MQHMLSQPGGPSKQLVHAIPYANSTKTLCNYEVFHFPHYMRRTDRPVECKKCRKALELVMREQLQKLSFAGLEKIDELVRNMRNGELTS